MAGGQKPASKEMPKLPDPVPVSPDEESPGNVLDGLGGLIDQFQKKGLGDVVDSWVNRGTNKNVAPDQVSVALGGDVVDQLARRTGLSAIRSWRIGPYAANVVDKLTPEGRLPTQQELMRLMS